MKNKSFYTPEQEAFKSLFTGGNLVGQSSSDLVRVFLNHANHQLAEQGRGYPPEPLNHGYAIQNNVDEELANKLNLLIGQGYNHDFLISQKPVKKSFLDPIIKLFKKRNNSFVYKIDNLIVCADCNQGKVYVYFYNPASGNVFFLKDYYVKQFEQAIPAKILNQMRLTNRNFTHSYITAFERNDIHKNAIGVRSLLSSYLSSKIIGNQSNFYNAASVCAALGLESSRVLDDIYRDQSNLSASINNNEPSVPQHQVYQPYQYQAPSQFASPEDAYQEYLRRKGSGFLMARPDQPQLDYNSEEERLEIYKDRISKNRNAVSDIYVTLDRSVDKPRVYKLLSDFKKDIGYINEEEMKFSLQNHFAGINPPASPISRLFNRDGEYDTLIKCIVENKNYHEFLAEQSRMQNYTSYKSAVDRNMDKVHTLLRVLPLMSNKNFAYEALRELKNAVRYQSQRDMMQSLERDVALLSGHSVADLIKLSFNRFNGEYDTLIKCIVENKNFNEYLDSLSTMLYNSGNSNQFQQSQQQQAPNVQQALGFLNDLGSRGYNVFNPFPQEEFERQEGSVRFKGKLQGWDLLERELEKAGFNIGKPRAYYLLSVLQEKAKYTSAEEMKESLKNDLVDNSNNKTPPLTAVSYAFDGKLGNNPDAELDLLFKCVLENQSYDYFDKKWNKLLNHDYKDELEANKTILEQISNDAYRGKKEEVYGNLLKLQTFVEYQTAEDMMNSLTRDITKVGNTQVSATMVLEQFYRDIYENANKPGFDDWYKLLTTCIINCEDYNSFEQKWSEASKSAHLTASNTTSQLGIFEVIFNFLQAWYNKYSNKDGSKTPHVDTNNLPDVPSSIDVSYSQPLETSRVMPINMGRNIEY